MTQILVGCDPEIFVKQNGSFVSAHGLIQGDKKNPQPVPFGAVQVDGMALEFNIDPAATSDAFIHNVSSVIATLRSMVPDYELAAVPVADFNPAYMKTQPAEALELGCEPDYNGWTLDANPRPDGDRPMRTASGHVHIGWTNGEDAKSGAQLQIAGAVARQMDFFLGLPSIFYDGDTRRRELYGKAGAYRPKTYGAEYRTLSNAWLRSEDLMKWVFDNTVAGMQRLMSGEALADVEGDISAIINNSDKDKAIQLIRKHNIAMPLGV